MVFFIGDQIIEKMKEFEEKQVIGITIFSHVCRHGKALYLYINKDAVGAYKICPEDKLEVQLGRHWKPNRPKEAEELSKKEKQ